MYGALTPGCDSQQVAKEPRLAVGLQGCRRIRRLEVLQLLLFRHVIVQTICTGPYGRMNLTIFAMLRFFALCLVCCMASFVQPQPHPRLRFSDSELEGLKAAIAAGGTAKRYYDSLITHGEGLLRSKPVNCSRSGVENSMLSQARTVLDISYSCSLLYRLTKNTSFATRAKAELLHVTQAYDPCLHSE